MSREVSRRLIEFSQPKISNGYLAWGAFDLDADQAGDVVRGVWVVIDINRHQLTVDDVDECSSTRYDLVLIPVIDFDVAAECVTASNVSDQTLGLSWL